jgi:hypothetical protein
MCARPLPWTRRIQFGRSHRLTGSSASTWSTFHLGGDAGIDQGGRRDTPSSVTVLSLRSVHTRRGRNRPEQPSIRPEPSRSQPELGSARPRSGCGDGAIRWILGSGHHRNARKQSERSVPPNVTVSVHRRRHRLDVAQERGTMAYAARSGQMLHSGQGSGGRPVKAVRPRSPTS